MKYIYQIINIPWYNSTVDVWPEGSPETKTRLLVFNFRCPAGQNLKVLKDTIQTKFSLDEVEVEEYTA